MSFQYGLRASKNLADIASNDDCLDNLNIDRNDLQLLVGTAAAGVTSSDYAALKGMRGNLQESVAMILTNSATSSGLVVQKASRNGDTLSGNVSAGTIDNDRPYYGSGNAIYGPSTASFFSPLSGTTYASGSSYRIGPLNPTIIQTSGLTYEGDLTAWSQYFTPYKLAFVVSEQPSWTSRNVPLYLPSPLQIDSNVLWLDAEFSTITIIGSGISAWTDVAGRRSATQSTATRRPTLASGIANGRNGVVFNGTTSSMTLGNLGILFPSGATLIVGAFIGPVGTSSGDTEYNIFSTLQSPSPRWRTTATGSGTFGVFTQNLASNFPPPPPASGNHIFTVRASSNHGISLRTDNQLVAQRTTQVAYSPGTAYRIGATTSETGHLTGVIYSLALFNEVLDDKTTRTIEEYFAWRYGLPSDL
jgi:hypothetical protein